MVELVRVVEQLRLDVDEDRALIDQLRADLAAGGGDDAKPAKRVYDTWQTWVDDWLVRISRHPHRYRWCRHYAEHPRSRHAARSPLARLGSALAHPAAAPRLAP